MSGTLVVHVDPNVLALAEESARASNTTLPEFVSEQLKWLARTYEDSRAGKTPLTDSLFGVARVSPAFDENDCIAAELLNKHAAGA